MKYRPARWSAKTNTVLTQSAVTPRYSPAFDGLNIFTQASAFSSKATSRRPPDLDLADATFPRNIPPPPRARRPVASPPVLSP